MLALTKTQVEQWQTWKLSEWATLIETQSQAFQDHLARMRGHFTSLNGSWSGKAHDAAYDRIATEHDQDRKLADEIGQLVAALRAADARLAGERRVLLDRVAEAQTPYVLNGNSIDITVTDKWEVTTTSTFTGPVSADALTKLQDEIRARQTAINTAYYNFANAVTEVDQTLNTEASEIRAKGDLLGNGIDAGTGADAGLTAEQGRADGETIADGKLSPEEIERIANNLAAAGLTPSQLAALERGEEVTIPASTMSYLTELYDKAGRDGLIGVSEQLRNDNSPTAGKLRESLANGLLTVSNENVVGRDYRNGKDDRGGWDKLHPEVKEIIGTRPTLGTDAPDSNTTRLPDDYRNNAWDSRNITGSYKDYVEDLNQFGDFLNSSSDDFQPGDRLGVELSRQAAHQIWLSDSGEYSGAMNPNERNLIDSRVDQTAQALLDVGTRNEDSNHALLTGKGGDELFGKGEPGQTFNDNYSFDTTIAPMLEHRWQDDGGSAAGLFNWINEDATSPDPLTATRAGEAASALSKYIAGNSDHLLDLDGDRTESLGQRNPALVQGMAQSLAPYIPNMAGVPDDLTLTEGFTPPDKLRGREGWNFDNAKAIFAVMDSDKEAAAYWNAHALTSASELESAWLATALDSPHGGNSNYAGAVGVIQGLVDSGINAEAADRTRDQTAQAAGEFADKSARYDAAKSLLTSSFKYLPVVGPVVSDIASNVGSPAIDIANSYVKNATLGIYMAPDPATPNADGTPSPIDPQRWYRTAQQLQDLRGSVTHDPDFDYLFDSSGQLLSYESLINNQDISPGQLGEDLNAVLRNYGDGRLQLQLTAFDQHTANGRAAVK
ncbi:hypothetical protein [Nocardia abscessus]|uniref:TPR repeat region-containing protein n=1 Tax=Nocardia abscessus TaxID=120957 RepID=UPI002455ABFD|nr:hypothetical protein [Nocardia abscessus]